MVLPTPLSDMAGRTLRELLHLRSATRPELSTALGVTKQTISAAIVELEQRELVEAVSVQKGPVGRSALRYALHRHAGWVAGVDLGTSRLRIAAARLDGTLITESSVANPSPTVLRHWADQLSLTAHALAAAALEISESEGGLLGVAIAVPRPVEDIRDLVGEKLDDADAELLDALAPVAPAAVWTENDVNCAAIAQLRGGLPLVPRSVLLLHVGIGLGAAFVLNGEVLRGARGRAGEIREVRSPLEGDERTAEAALSAEGLLAAAGHSLSAPLLTAVDDLFAAALMGDSAAEAAFEAEAGGLSRLVVELSALVDPEMVVLSGLIGGRSEVAALVARRCAEQRLAATVITDPFGDHGAVVGAATLAAERVMEALAPAARAPDDLYRRPLEELVL